VFSTTHDDQRVVKLEIYEGEGRRVEDNRRIGELDVTGIPKGTAPKDVRVRFTYDQNGMLEVEAEVVETKATVSAVFRRSGDEVRGADLERARARLKAVRADPMDRPRYRDLYARAKLLWSELDQLRRARLDALLDAFDAAMTRRDPVELERTYQALLKACESVDHGERW
jgi:molecular chaperone HscC